MQNYLAKYSVIPALSKMLADFELEEDSEYRKRVRENRNQAIRKLEERNKDKRHLERERLASYGLAIGSRNAKTFVLGRVALVFRSQIRLFNTN